MSKPHFTYIQRQAFWTVYKKCSYCGKLLERVSDLELDHLIPKNKKAQLPVFRDQFGLASSFCIDSYENIIASCSSCNKKKGSKTIQIVNPILVNLACTNAIKVSKKEASFNKKLILNRGLNTTTIPFTFFFKEKVAKGPISKSKLIDLEEYAVWLGDFESIELTGHSNPKKKVLKYLLSKNGI